MSAVRASLLLPVRDAEDTLAACLRSIARQSEPRFDVVIVDDGSRDRSLEIAQAFAANDARFGIFARAREGLVPALNAGIAELRAAIAVRMDADDVMHRHRLRDQLAALEDPSLSAVGTRVRFFPRATMTQGLVSYERWINAISSPEDVVRDSFIECPIAHPTLAIRREVLAEHRYRDMGWPEDYDLVLRLIASGHRMAVVPARRHLWRDHPERLSRRDATYSIERFTACRAHHLARTFAAPERYVLWGYGDTAKALRRALVSEGKTVAAIVELHPGRIGQKIYGAPVIRPEELRAHARDLPILVSVAGAVARAEIRGALAEMGFIERRDFVCCA